MMFVNLSSEEETLSPPTPRWFSHAHRGEAEDDKPKKGGQAAVDVGGVDVLGSHHFYALVTCLIKIIHDT